MLTWTNFGRSSRKLPSGRFGVPQSLHAAPLHMETSIYLPRIFGKAGPDPLCVVITESHTEIQEILGHVSVGLRAYSYLFWLTDSNTKVYGLHALMFMTEAAANHRIHRGRSQSHYFPLIMTAIMPSMYHKAHKVKAELHSKATQKTSSKVYLALSAPAPGQTFRDNKISFGILL